MSRLFIYLRSPAEFKGDVARLPAVEWVLLEEDGELISHAAGDGSTLAELVHSNVLDDPQNVVAVIPTEYCLCLTCDVPGRSAGQMRRALPFVVEEFLATDVDAMHIAHLPLKRNEPVACVAVEESALAAWLTALRVVGVIPGFVVAEAELLPARAGEVSCLFRDDEVVLRSGREMLSVAADDFVMGASTLVSRLEDTELTITAINARVDSLSRSQIEQALRDDQRLKWRDAETDVPAPLYLARTWLNEAGESQALNLLQGPYTPPRRRGPGLGGWRNVAVIAGVCVAVALVTQGARGIWAGYRADVLDEQARALYRDVFPNDQRIVDLRKQWAAHIGEATGDEAPFLPLLGELARALGDARGSSLKSLSFASSRDELSAEVEVQGFDGLDQLKNSLDRAGLTVEISSAEQEEGKVRARMRMRFG